VTSIDPRQRLAAIVRDQVAALRERAAAQPPPGSGKQGVHPGAATALPGLLAQRIGAISHDDPERRQKAFRVFLETALLHRLGGALIRDASFPTLVDAVQQRMQADAQLAGAADELALHLLEKARN
jgi:hypothetical protein